MHPSGCDRPRAACRRSASHTPPVWMPTSAVFALMLGASAPPGVWSMDSASGVAWCVASRKCCRMSCAATASSTALRFCQCFLPALRSSASASAELKRLVDEGDGNIEAAVRLVGEASAAPGQRMLGAVGRGRQADDQAHCPAIRRPTPRCARSARRSLLAEIVSRVRRPSRALPRRHRCAPGRNRNPVACRPRGKPAVPTISAQAWPATSESFA